MSAAKPKVAFYWCSSCGGCEEAFVDLDAALLDVAAAVEIVLWPVALDFKYSNVQALDDGAIAVSFINGAIRTDEQEEIAHLLRRKSQLLIAFGSCAHMGGVPGLANLTSREAIFEAAYRHSPTVDNPDGPVPCTDSKTADLPAFWEQVRTLAQVVEVDYFVPGCPPMPDLISDAIGAILNGTLPERGTVLAPDKALCDTCPRWETRDPDIRLDKIYRVHEIVADPEACFLNQGLVCCGPGTRGGCGEPCIHGNMPCTGCMGPTSGVVDQGAKVLSAIASLLDCETEDDAMKLAKELVDPAGSFYRYSVADSLLQSSIVEGKQ